MRLIDADKLKEYFTHARNLSKQYGKGIDLMIDDQPTAFDIGKVVEQLRKAEYNHADYGHDYAIDTETAIDIVEAGGVRIIQEN